jgi:hypothetical protein
MISSHNQELQDQIYEEGHSFQLFDHPPSSLESEEQVILLIYLLNDRCSHRFINSRYRIYAPIDNSGFKSFHKCYRGCILR